MASQLAYLLLVSWLAMGSAIEPLNTNIGLGSSLHPTAAPTSWLSPSGLFAFGFYPDRSGFYVGAWLIGTSGNITVIWTAFPNQDPFPNHGVSLNLTSRGLKLQNATTEDQFISQTSTVTSASILDSGNFIIYGHNKKILWQTFDHPTITIMAGQKLAQGSALFSSVLESDHSARYQLRMQLDGNLVLYIANTTKSYWATATNNANFINCSLNLDADGHLYLLGNNGSIDLWRSNQESTPAIYFLSFNIDGTLRLYLYDPAGLPTVLAQFPDDRCEVPSACGLNSYCTYDDELLECLCIPGFDYSDPHDHANGCAQKTTRSCPSASTTGDNSTMVSLQSVVWLDDLYDTTSSIYTTEGCKDYCRQDCSCDAAIFDRGICKKQRFPVANGRRDTTSLTVAYIKVVAGGLVAQAPIAGLPVPIAAVPKSTKKSVSTILIVCGIVIVCLVIAIVVLGFVICRHGHARVPRSSMVEENLAFPRRYSYKELSEATGEFKEKLGKGSFGTVFKGALSISPRGEQVAVAVKRLEKLVEEGEQEFRAEMRAIGRTHHKNLVRLLGFCDEGSNRLLVYELMTNGSLAGIIFNTPMAARPHWSERVRIVLDVARGINYLHEDCETCIIHCDIKPQNILMNDNWTAKISDFGLAKLLIPNQTRTFTGMRGTRGYLAPEWAMNAPISVKADVYSFGVVLLEIICCRRNIEPGAQSDEIILTNWVSSCFVGGELSELVAQDEEVDKKQLERLLKVGLWCIQNEPTLRPYMKNVVMMLEEDVEVPIPP